MNPRLSHSEQDGGGMPTGWKEMVLIHTRGDGLGQRAGGGESEQ